jgi:hypothetical protein
VALWDHLVTRGKNQGEQSFGEQRKKKGREMELWKESGDHTDPARMSGGHQNKSLEWNLDDWRWDTNLFLATPSSTALSECGGRGYVQSQGENDFGVVDKRRRVTLEDGSAECGNAAITNMENRSGVVVQRGHSSEEDRPRKGASSSSPPSCQVDGCQADLSGARDYHKRHKVCEAHTRSSMVRIKSVEHRFCQQCSRLVRNFFPKPLLLFIYLVGKKPD